jgi:hypothetical protein
MKLPVKKECMYDEWLMAEVIGFNPWTPLLRLVLFIVRQLFIIQAFSWHTSRTGLMILSSFLLRVAVTPCECSAALSAFGERAGL